jgi:heme/copper-type cytochrome/quinol oxidase subunit 1
MFKLPLFVCAQLVTAFMLLITHYVLSLGSVFAIFAGFHY